MKKIYMRHVTIYSLILCLLSCLFAGCESDLEKVIMTPGTASNLTLSNPGLVLTQESAADTVVTLSWTPTDYGYSAAVQYTVQIAKSGTDFANPLEVSVGSARTLKYTGADLNQLALIRGLAPANAGQLDVRIKSTLTDTHILYSASSTLTVTPYLVVINYPSLWVPGDYQSWNAATAPKISSRLSNGIYEGYVNITPGTLQFKYTSEADWNHLIYGWASSTISGEDVSGTFSTSGGNLFVPVAGYYLLKANVPDSTWSATRITKWGVIGDFNNWSTDVEMVYDAQNNVWTATIDPSASGGFKFRANGAYTINLGDTGGDLILDYDGANIPVTVGSKTIILDLSAPGNYTYKIQ